ncbi:MAG: DUF937 domain-containing protein [Hyphomicrobiaceae bacterium]|nr:DUF937 domain-containing protein [Hyphomicrobiaceae bacterium]
MPTPAPADTRPPGFHPTFEPVDGRGINALAAAFGLSSESTRLAADRLDDVLQARLERLALSRGGVTDVLGLIGMARWDALPLDAASLKSDEVRVAGDAALAVLLGDKHQSRVIAERIAREAGLAVADAKRMLPVIAALFMRGARLSAAAPVAALAQRLPVAAANAALAFDGQAPLPLPGEPPGGAAPRSDPFRDLSDILRRDGRSAPLPLPEGPGGRPAPGSEIEMPRGGSLWSIVRALIARALNFRSNGIVGWIVQYIVLRYGWRILSFILGRVFGRR